MVLINIGRPKTLFLTITVFAFGLFVTLNLMVTHLNSDDGISSKQLGAVFRQNAEGENVKELFSQGQQRKPKATNLENNSQDENRTLKINRQKSNQDINVNKQGDPNEYHSYYGTENDFNSEDEKKIEDMELLEDENEDDYDDDEEEEDYNPNPVFKPGDFGDIRGLEYFKKPPLKFEVLANDSHHEQTNKKFGGKSSALTEDGLYWSSYAESLIPKGLSYSNVTKLLRSIRSKHVKYLKPPNWKRCGRPKNGFVQMFDGTFMCARYRHPHMALVFGEILSFYLSRLLSMDNVPAVVLVTANSTSPQWRATNITSLKWEENKIIALIQWIPDIDTLMMSEIKIPPLLLKAYQSGNPITMATLQSSTLHSNEISELVQWGTMIVFDYLTANYDRVASMQDAAEKEKKPSIIEEPIRNLRKSSKTGKLWLIDNESGLLDAYELLNDRRSGGRFFRFHMEMLRTMCMFQSSLVSAITSLYKAASPHTRLENFAKSHEPLLEYMKHDETYDLFAKLFSQRLKDVVEWINHCKTLSDS